MLLLNITYLLSYFLYVCVCVNEGRLVRQRRRPPHISVFPDDVTVMPGTAVNLTCEALGHPTPNVSWRLRSSDVR